MKIEIEISDEWVTKMGATAIEDLVHKELELNKLKELTRQLDEKMKTIPIDWEKEWLSARDEAWNVHKHKYINVNEKAI